MDIKKLDNLYLKWVKSLDDEQQELAIDDPGLPSTWDAEPYLEDLPHVLNDYSFDYEKPLPEILIAYNYYLWSGVKISTDHELIVNREKWRNLIIDDGFGLEKDKVDDMNQLYKLLRDNVDPSYDIDIPDTAESTDINNTESTFILSLPIGGYYVKVLDDLVAFLSVDDNMLRVFDFNGNEMTNDIDNQSAISSFIINSPKNKIDISELHSLIGNDLADLVIGNDTISILDLPPKN